MTRIRMLAAAVALAATSAVAQYPTKPIRMIVPFAAGGPTDFIARTLGRAMSDSMGQPVLVENRPGADGQIAVQAVWSAPADGYTLYVAPGSTTSGMAALNKGLAFNPLDLTAISTVATITYGLYVSRDVAASNVAELVRHAKAHPGQLNFATSTYGEELATMQFMKATGTQMVKVPYKGSAQAIPELLAGRIQVYIAPVTPDRIAFVKAGQLRLLATLSPERTAFTPDVPTLAEAGIDVGALPDNWNSLMAPPKLPPELTQRLAREVEKALKNATVRTALEGMVLQVRASSPEAMHEAVLRDYRIWSNLAKELTERPGQ